MSLDEAKSYTAKLDIFSFGVIVIQILTMLFPKPTDRFLIVRMQQSEEEEREVPEVAPETERRKTHLQLIPDTHTLKPLVNPRRACAARVTVYTWFVCLSVDSLIWQYRERGGL